MAKKIYCEFVLANTDSNGGEGNGRITVYIEGGNKRKAKKKLAEQFDIKNHWRIKNCRVRR